eukprot:gene5687-7520_t
METRANNALIGLFTLVVIAAAFAFVYWFARAADNGAVQAYRVVFNGAVTGLSVGSSVLFNGIRVGEVTDLNLDPEKGDQVIARVRLDATTPVRVTSRAQLEPQGITGLNYIQITAGTDGSALLKTQYPDNVVPVIQ